MLAVHAVVQASTSENETVGCREEGTPETGAAAGSEAQGAKVTIQFHNVAR